MFSMRTTGFSQTGFSRGDCSGTGRFTLDCHRKDSSESESNGVDRPDEMQQKSNLYQEVPVQGNCKNRRKKQSTISSNYQKVRRMRHLCKKLSIKCDCLGRQETGAFRSRDKISNFLVLKPFQEGVHMKPVRFIIISLYLSFHIVHGVMAANPCNVIDAVTSASEMLHIKGGEACATSASVVWNDYYCDGTQQLIKYGKTTSYGSVINLKPFTEGTDITTDIPNLVSNTPYYGQFFRVYEGVTHTTDFTFNTSGAALRETPQRGSMQPPSIRVGSAVFTLDVQAGSTVGIALYSLTGARIALQNTVADRSVEFAKIVPAGVYLCKVTTASGTISHATVIGK
jgi:hypothetical protein